MIHYESWFPHDANADSDPKLESLIAEFGWQAAGWYWDLLCKLRKSQTGSIEWSKPYVQTSLAKRYGISVETLRTFVEHMLNICSLMFVEDGDLRSNGMDRHLENLETISQKRALAGQKSGESRRKKRKTANTSSTHVEHLLNKTEQTRTEEKRREERRGGDARADATPIDQTPAPEVEPKFQKPTIPELEAEFKRHNHPNPAAQASKFWNHYESKGWKVGKTPMKSWKAAIASQWINSPYDQKPASGPQPPKVKPQNQVKNTGITFEEAMGVVKPDGTIPF